MQDGCICVWASIQIPITILGGLICLTVWHGFMGVIRDCQCFSELRNKPGDSMVPLAYRFPFNRALNPDDRANADSFTYGRPTSQLSYVDEYMYSIF